MSLNKKINDDYRKGLTVNTFVKILKINPFGQEVPKKVVLEPLVRLRFISDVFLLLIS